NNYEGRVYVVYGPFTDGSTIDLAHPSVPVKEISSPGPGAYVGYSLATADFNRDGFDDILIGAPFADSGNGAAYILYGGKSLKRKISTQRPPPGRVTVFTAVGEGSRVGYAVAAGDVNGDGLPDPVVSAPLASPQGRETAGAVYVTFSGDFGTA